MYHKLHCLLHWSIALLLGLTMMASGHAQSSSAPVTATLHGQIADPSGALIPGAKVEILTSAGTHVTSRTADGQGDYEARGLAPGDYIIVVTFNGFAPFQSETLTLKAGEIKRVNVQMAIQVAQQSVVVSDDTPTVSVDASDSANSVVIRGNDLNALSDDPDELSAELSALAGPSAGPNGGQIYIDGFTGGQLPPKSAIREIRINRNPFSAEFDRLGYGRIEILTKPGTDQLHGQVFIQGNESALNTGNPFIANVPAYNRIQYNGSISGSLNKKTSFFLSMEQRDNHDQDIYVYTPAVLDSTTNQYTLGSPVSGTLSNPHNHINISPRIDVQLGQTNTLTLRYQFYYDSQSGDLGSQQLPTQAVTSTSKEHSLQLSDSQIINDHMVNETRFEYRRGISSTTPVSTAPTIVSEGNFTGGGSSGGAQNSHSDHFELQDYITMSHGRHAIKFGAWLRDDREATSSFANRNGTLSFTEQGYVDALNALATGQSLSTLPAGDFQNLTIGAGRTSYSANVFNGALFVEDDWNVNKRLTLSGGIRWETQNHIADHNDWAPRVALAYALDGGGKKPAKTVWRAGYGIFYDRLGVGSVLSATSNGADSGQVKITNTSPNCLEGTSLTDMNFSGCLPAAPYSPTPQTTTVEIAPGFHAPYTNQFGTSIERQLTKTSTVTVTYLRSFGVHQIVTRDANAYLPGTYDPSATTQTASRPNPNLGVVNEFYPEAVFKQNQIIVNFNAQLSPKFHLFGFYSYSNANSNGAGGTASNSYNLDQDYGRAAFVRRNMFFMMGAYTGPFGVQFNPFVIAHSGSPYNILSNQDLTGDHYMNDRPAYADSSLCTDGSTRYYQTKYGCLDATPQAGETLVPVNMGDSPAPFAINLRVSRRFGIGPKVENGNAGGMMWHGHGHGLGPGGLGGGPPMGHHEVASRKFNLTLTAQALNLFNVTNYGTPVGTLGNSNFGKSTSLAGGPFSNGAASRRIFLQAIFSF
ncbi:MAG TPA: carboxypeptidase regulatory-like domain-containing protein [Terracidiphilus sp.]|nr:carboxypeptidase regulatory-like domain-containing protein [Terracidiphilus sp.]